MIWREAQHAQTEGGKRKTTGVLRQDADMARLAWRGSAARPWAGCATEPSLLGGLCSGFTFYFLLTGLVNRVIRRIKLDNLGLI